MFKKIIIPTDGSSLANMAAMHGIELASKIGAEVASIFVAREKQNPNYDSSEDRTIADPSDAEYKKAVQEAADRYMQPLKDAAAKAGVKFSQLVCISNETAMSIATEAQNNGGDLIYMGSHGYTGWAKLLMGSVAAKVFAASAVPVLIYKFPKEEVTKKQVRKSYLEYFEDMPPA